MKRQDNLAQGRIANRREALPRGSRPQKKALAGANKTARHLSIQQEKREVQEQLRDLFNINIPETEIPDFLFDREDDLGVFSLIPFSNRSNKPVKGYGTLRMSLIILTLLMSVGAAGSDKVLEADLLANISRIVEAIKSAAQTTGQKAENLVEQGLDFYRGNVAGVADSAVKNTFAALLVANSKPGRSRIVTGLTAGLSQMPTLVSAAKGGAEQSNFWLQPDKEIIKEIKALAQGGGKELANILKGAKNAKNKNSISPLFAAVQNGKHDLVRSIIKNLKDHPVLLAELLLEKHPEIGDLESLVFKLFVKQTDAELLKIIIESLEQNPSSRSKISQILDEQKVIHICEVRGDKEALKVICDKLDHVIDNEYLLLKILRAADKEMLDIFFKNFPINDNSLKFLASNILMIGCFDNYDSFEAVILTLKQHNPELLKKHLIEDKILHHLAAIDAQKNVGLLVSVAASFGKDNFKLMLGKSAEKLQGSDESTVLSALHCSLISGNKDAAFKILQVLPEETLGALPIVYHSKLPKTTLYYLEAIAKKESAYGHPIATSYFEVKDGKRHPIKLEDISSFENPIMVVVEDQGVKRESLFGGRLELATTYDEYSKTKVVKNISKLLKCATQEKRDLVINFQFTHDVGGESLSHQISIKFSSDPKNPDKWNAYVHDSDFGRDIDRDRTITTNCLTEIFRYVGNINSGWEKDPLREVVPNYPHPKMPDGICGPLTEVATATLLLGGYPRMAELKKECDEIGKESVDIMNAKFHPFIDKMLQEELQKLKEKLPPRLDFEAIGMRRLIGTRTTGDEVPR